MADNTRLYRTRGTSDCPISKTCYRPSRIMPDFALIHWHPDIEFLYVEEGSFNMRADQNTLQLFPGDIRLVTPGQIHGIQCLTPSGKYWSIAFSPVLISLPENHFFQKEFSLPLQEGQLTLPPVLRPSDALYPSVFRHITSILNCDESAPDYKPVVFSSAIAVCAALMPYCKKVSAQEAAPGNMTVRACVDYMQAHYAEKISLQEIADSVYLHPNYLCSLFKKYTGQTVFDYLTQYRIQQAAMLLRHQPMPIAQVAERCGFNSPSLFAQKFREQMGTSPKAYCKNHS